MSPSTTSRPLVLRAAWAAGLAVSAVAISACGGGAADEKQGTADVSASAALVAKYRELPRFTPPGQPFDAREGMRGKKVMAIGVSDQIPLIQEVHKEMAAQARRIGFTFTRWRNQGKPDQWIQGINTAIAQGYDTIDLLALDPKLVRPQLEKARAAGIKVIASHLAGFGWEIPDYVDGAVRLPYREVGRVLAAHTIVETEGKANVLGVVSDELASTTDLVAGLREEYAANCPACTLRIANVPATQWATGVQNEVSSGLQRDPNVNYLLPVYDGMSQFAVAGVALAGKAGKVPLATFNGTPFALDLVREGKLAMNVGENESWIARAILDADMRAAMGDPVPATSYDKAPLLVFTKSNVATAGTPAQSAQGYGDEWQTGFDRLWGLG